jgi:hypothetical protein
MTTTFSERKWATPTVSNSTLHTSQPAKVHSGTNLKTAQRHTVRLALLTGGVIAALVGAQALALLDNSLNVQPSQTATTIQINPSR